MGRKAKPRVRPIVVSPFRQEEVETEARPPAPVSEVFVGIAKEMEGTGGGDAPQV